MCSASSHSLTHVIRQNNLSSSLLYSLWISELNRMHCVLSLFNFPTQEIKIWIPHRVKRKNLYTYSRLYSPSITSQNFPLIILKHQKHSKFAYTCKKKIKTKWANKQKNPKPKNISYTAWAGGLDCKHLFSK